MKKRYIPATAAVLGTVVMLTACGGNTAGPGNTGEPPEEGITYQEYDASTVTFLDNHDAELANYDKSLYYLNDWKLGYAAPTTKGNYFPDMGDPMIVYDNGYYYAFGTRGATSFHCFRSKDFTTWERLTDAFVPESKSWGKTNLWAPDIQKIGDKWYLYYTAEMKYPDGASHCQIGVAIADNVYGPYTQFTGKNADGEDIGLDKTPFTGLGDTTVLDQTVFIDDDGEMYMYFSYDTKTGSEERKNLSPEKGLVSEIWGVKMKDAVTWDLSTLTPLISPGYKKYSDKKRTVDWETWSPSFTGGMQCCEGPYMIKQNGKYFLTYCANSFVDAEYAVGYAVSDSPLGGTEGFVKPTGKYLENMLLGVPGAPGTYIANRYKGFTRGTGHAAIFKTGDGNDYMFAYHAHFNREKWGDKMPDNYRALAVDYLYFDADGNPYTNGPTYSLQRTPGDVSGLINLVKSAKITAEGTHPEYLTDNYTNRAINSAEEIKETQFEAGTRSIEIKFDKPVSVKALNIYNSCDYEKYVNAITQIDFGEGRGLINARFNRRYVKDDFIFPHSAFNIELGKAIVTDRIVITITNNDYDFALGEIEVMGKYVTQQ